MTTSATSRCQTHINPEEIIARAQDMSSMPASASRIMEIVSDAAADAGDLQGVIAHDPTLTSKLLKMVNSAFYGFSSPVADIRRAIVLLGFNAVRNLALSVSVCEMFRSEDKVGSYSRWGQWQHSVVVGLATRMVCRRVGINPSEEGFLAGTVHDIGLILEDQYAHDAFVIAQTEAQKAGVPLWEVEREVLGTDHAELGGLLGAKWGFPPSITSAIARHHQPLSAGKDNRLVLALHIADFLAYAKNIGTISSAQARPHSEAFKSLGLSRADVIVILEDLDEEIENARCFLEM